MANPVRGPRIARLSEPDFLATLVGPVESVRPESMGTPGYSGSALTRFHVRLAEGGVISLVLKHTRLAEDWIAFRTGDTLGREAQVVGAPELAPAWEAFVSPYLAFAIEPGETGLLMRDLGPFLFPDVREPLAVEAEEAVLASLARLHARFWDRAPERPWLASEADTLTLVGPMVLGEDTRPPVPGPLGERVVEGWREAFRRLPARKAEALRRPAADVLRAHADLPQTLLHGDPKVANLARLPDGGVVAFDWSMTARAPATLDLGWYLAVNATRLARSKEQVIARYRALLEAALGRAVDAATWSRLLDLAILDGAFMLLWSKALALREERPGAREEWEWWVERLPG